MGNRFAEINTSGRPDSQSPLVVIAATTSARRLSFLEHALPNAIIVPTDGGDEEETSNVVRIAGGKIEHARITKPDHTVIIAADTRTSTLTIDDEGHTYLRSRGKPKTENGARNVFAEMVQANAVDGSEPYYVVRSGSGSHTRRGQSEERVSAEQSSTIVLDLDSVKYLATDEGFDAYRKEFHAFYASGLYVNEGHHKPIGIRDLSGGMSIPVLTKMGIVTSIDGIERGDPQFRQAFLHAFLNAAVGISPTVLRGIQPDIDERMTQWDWANLVTDDVLESPQNVSHRSPIQN